LKAMEGLHNAYPADKEAAIFYALALVGAADASDKTYRNQKRAGEILIGLYPREPNHPGIVHYLIHAYDSPELASLALPAARKYAAIAPSSAHAQHMPSHIFTRLGLWDEAIRSNAGAASSAKCYAESAGIKGHWDEELHAIDYLVYAYLQKGDNASAMQQLDYLKTIKRVEPANFKVAYAYAAVPARYVLENKLWKEAASLHVYPSNVAWQKFPWQKAIVHFTRLLGNVHTGSLTAAKEELKALQVLRDTLAAQKDAYKTNQVAIQIKAGEAWIAFAQGEKQDALQLMTEAADAEDKTEKAPVTPGEVLPAKELLADLLMQLNKPAEALMAYDIDLKKHPNRFNGLYGAAAACEKLNDATKATGYYKQLVGVAGGLKGGRPELQKAKAYLNENHMAYLSK
jgi:tetratricopeptide (TPR) repeat protein